LDEAACLDWQAVFVCRRRRKVFFFEKKKQKTFDCAVAALSSGTNT
jgi:hypothetical protein